MSMMTAVAAEDRVVRKAVDLTRYRARGTRYVTAAGERKVESQRVARVTGTNPKRLRVTAMRPNNFVFMITKLKPPLGFLSIQTGCSLIRRPINNAKGFLAISECGVSNSFPTSQQHLKCWGFSIRSTSICSLLLTISSFARKLLLFHGLSEHRIFIN